MVTHFPPASTSIYKIYPEETVYVVTAGDSWYMHVSARGPYGCDAMYEVSQPSEGLKVDRTLDGIDVELDTDEVGSFTCLDDFIVTKKLATYQFVFETYDVLSFYIKLHIIFNFLISGWNIPVRSISQGSLRRSDHQEVCCLCHFP